ncbi:MAG: hypothetical protein OXC63_05855 [Aestuariivita sp.]|nr:hypothetical protein [Aestuariivita sp.]MCY4346335.1 hypothetical protein [Aestuariivita sp.]
MSWTDDTDGFPLLWIEIVLDPLDNHIKCHLTQCLIDIGQKLDTDLVTIISPIVQGLEHRLRRAIETLQEHKRAITIILDTPGRVVKVVERMVAVIRPIYQEVIVIVPDWAISAGTFSP